MQLREKLCGHCPSKPFQQPSRPLQLRYVSAEKSNNTLSGVSGTDGCSMWEAEVQRCVTDVAAAVKPFCKNEQERRPRPSVAKPTQIFRNCSAGACQTFTSTAGQERVVCAVGGWRALRSQEESTSQAVLDFREIATCVNFNQLEFKCCRGCFVRLLRICSVPVWDDESSSQ